MKIKSKRIKISGDARGKAACVFLAVFFIASFIISYNLNHVYINRAIKNYNKTIHMDEVNESAGYVYAMQLDKLESEEMLKERYADKIIDEVNSFYSELTGVQYKLEWEVISIVKAEEYYGCKLNRTFTGDAEGISREDIFDREINVACNSENWRIWKIVCENNVSSGGADIDDYGKKLELKRQEILSREDGIEERYHIMGDGGVRERFDAVYAGMCRYSGVYPDNDIRVLLSLNEGSETATLYYLRQMGDVPGDIMEGVCCIIEFNIMSGKIIYIENFN